MYNWHNKQHLFKLHTFISFSSVQFSSVAQSCPTLCNPINCSLPGFSIHGILQARISSVQFISVHFSRSVVSDSLQPHESQHARPPCPSPTPGVHPNPCLLSWWCHPTISSSVIPFSSHLQSFPASQSFKLDSFSHQVAKYWSFSFNISSSNEYSGLISFSIDWLDLLAVQGTLKSLLQHHSSEATILWHSAFCK